ncbi:MAG: hypothetical protein GKC53_04560 [Neisseriaceae bacterium]|nr:MAG: hypothetical protein GKC53_04560 [Neisseriaceae bacterium]
MKKNILAVSALVLLGACSSGDKISKKEVKKSISQIYKDEPICLRIRLALDDSEIIPNYRFGDQQIKIKYKDIDGKKVNKSAVEQMNILKKQGYYEEAGTEKIKLQDNISTTYKVWNITDKGTQYFNGGSAVCVGHFEFSDLLYYSIPATSLGRQVSHVTYTVEPKIDRWAKPFLKITDKNYEKYLGKEQEKSATFYLTNKGWKILRGNI